MVFSNLLTRNQYFTIMKKRNLKNLKLKKNVISNLTTAKITGGTQYVCPTFAADRVTCPGYDGNPTPCEYPKSNDAIICQKPAE
ncbi:hypothetical protein C8N46_10268 [Kordia periserrulae]|uniref:Uncharacterized protein n=2 Tax=Kordia periserrulae TaxID=701523 RepID=A0A2T6C2W8_9FLAO|nr:hypothetical protein C8N46_10268 [Kordia periserrulae]